MSKLTRKERLPSDRFVEKAVLKKDETQQGVSVEPKAGRYNYIPKEQHAEQQQQMLQLCAMLEVAQGLKKQSPSAQHASELGMVSTSM